MSELHRLRATHSLSYVFLNLLDLEQGHTFFVTDHAPTQDVFHDLFRADFNSGVAELDRLILRKEMFMPLRQKLTPDN